MALKTVPQKPPLYKTFDRITTPVDRVYMLTRMSQNSSYYLVDNCFLRGIFGIKILFLKLNKDLGTHGLGALLPGLICFYSDASSFWISS